MLFLIEILVTTISFLIKTVDDFNNNNKCLLNITMYLLYIVVRVCRYYYWNVMLYRRHYVFFIGLIKMTFTIITYKIKNMLCEIVNWFR